MHAMSEKRKSVMVLPINGDKILLQSFKNLDGNLVWDGFGSFYQIEENPEVTANNVFIKNFRTKLSSEHLIKRARLNYQINKPNGLIDLDVTVYFAVVEHDLHLPDRAKWFMTSKIPYTNMHEATGMWLPLLLTRTDNVEAQIKVEQPADHTEGKVTEFTKRQQGQKA